METITLNALNGVIHVGLITGMPICGAYNESMQLLWAKGDRDYNGAPVNCEHCLRVETVR